MFSKEHNMADGFVTVKLIITNPKTGEITSREVQIQKGIEIRTSKSDDKKHDSIYRISEKTKSIELDPAMAGELEAIIGVDGDDKLSINDAQMLNNGKTKDISIFMSNAQEKVEKNGSLFNVDDVKKGQNSIKVGAKDPQTYESTGLEIRWRPQ